jgi:hypothetical protein
MSAAESRRDIRKAMLLNSDNYSRGFLLDGELMAGVTEHPERTGEFLAFVLRPETGEYLGYETYPALEGALTAINGIPRQWEYQKIGGCGDGECTGNCSNCGGCPV